MDPAQFVIDFPEFADANLYPVSLITFWLNVATQLVNAGLWQGLTNVGIELLAAHNLVLEVQAARVANNGAPGGIAQGPIAAKSVDKVSINFAVEAAKEEGAGQYNTTTYGQRYYRLAMMFGAGGLQL
jgi:hypothetical protein